jgi:hypothetical protein
MQQLSTDASQRIAAVPWCPVWVTDVRRSVAFTEHLGFVEHQQPPAFASSPLDRSDSSERASIRLSRDA